MDSVTQILTQVQPYKGEYNSIRKRQSIRDLMGDIMDKHEKNEMAANAIAAKFWKGNVMDTAKYLYDYYKGRIKYGEEDTDNQTVKTLAAIHVEGIGDCKHFSQAIVSVCCALRRMGYPIKAKYRFAVYNNQPNEKGVRSGHVFAVIMDKGKEIWCDPVVSSFDQRFPVYISHQDRVPPLGKLPAARLGQVWDVSGISNSETVTGMANATTLGWVDYIQRGTVGAHHHHKHHKLLDRFIDSPLNPIHPGIYTPHLAERVLNGYSAMQDDRGTLYTMSGVGIGWIDEILCKGGTHGHHVTKHKAPKQHKPHKKLQLGKFLKKYNLGLVTLRNAFLGVLKLNLFHLGSQMQDKVLHNPKAKDKLYNWWKKNGGNPNKLSTALTQAMHVWNAHHKAHKISGGFNEGMSGHHLMMPDEEMTFGVVQLAIPAMIAAATPMIIEVKKLLAEFGLKGPSKEDLDKANHDAAANHNDATGDDGDGKADIKEDGSVDHGEGVSTKVETDPVTGKQTISYDVKDQVADDGGDDTPAPGKQASRTKTKTTTDDDETDAEGDDVDTETKTKTITTVTPPGGGTGVMGFFNKVKDFAKEHPAGLAITGIGAISLLYSIVHKFPKKSSAPVMLGIGGGIAVVIGGMQLIKKPA